MTLPSPPLLVISDRRQATRPLVEIAEAVFRGRLPLVQPAREGPSRCERRDLLRGLVALGRRYGATVTVHEDVEAAVATGAGGVHLPGGGDPAAARRLLPSGLIGVSAHSPEEAATQLKAGADYATLSPIFLTQSKPGYGPAVGLVALAEAARLAPGPVVALGGIDEGNIAACLATGARGIAVMGEIMRAADPEEATRRLLAALDCAEEAVAARARIRRIGARSDAIGGLSRVRRETANSGKNSPLPMWNRGQYGCEQIDRDGGNVPSHGGAGQRSNSMAALRIRAAADVSGQWPTYQYPPYPSSYGYPFSSPVPVNPYVPTTPPSWSYDPYTSGMSPCPQRHAGDPPCSETLDPSYGQPSFWPR